MVNGVPILEDISVYFVDIFTDRNGGEVEPNMSDLL